MAHSFTVLTTVDDVVAQLGGMKRVARMTKCGVTAVHNWRARGCFPARFYVRMQTKLIENGFVAPAKLWGQDYPIRLTKRSGQTLNIAA